MPDEVDLFADAIAGPTNAPLEDVPTRLRQGKVTARWTIGVRAVGVNLGSTAQPHVIPKVAMLTHLPMPEIGATVWIVHYGQGRWLYLGQQG